MSSEIIQPPEIDILMQYVHAGMRLPMTEAEYCARLQVSSDTADKISGAIGPLVAIYAPAKSECLECFMHTYPATAETAFAILTQAQRATEGLEYGEIVQAIKDLDKASSDEEWQRLQKFITDTIDAELHTLDDDRKQAQEVLDGLGPFMDHAGEHEGALNAYSVTLGITLTTEDNTLRDLQSALDTLRVEADEAGLDAGLKLLIAEYEDKVSKQQSVVEALTTIRVDLKETLSLLDPAVVILEVMVKDWLVIDDALGRVRDMADSDLRNASSVIVDRVVGKLLGKWYELMEHVLGYPPA